MCSSFQHKSACYWSSSDEDKVLDLRESSRLASRLSTQTDGQIDVALQNDWPTTLFDAIEVNNGIETDDHSRPWCNLR